MASTVSFLYKFRNTNVFRKILPVVQYLPVQCCWASSNALKTNAEMRQVKEFIWRYRFKPFMPSAEIDKVELPADFRFVYPEFLPDPRLEWRNKIRERLERTDMLKRRVVMEIPEFCVGSIMAVTVADPNATGKSNRFVGICIARGGTGLRAWFTLRNIIDHLGVEIMYEMYCPLVQNIDVLRLEKRLDDELYYLRDALPEYCTVPVDMMAEYLPEGEPVPVNEVKVVLKPRPWHVRWERSKCQGLAKLDLPEVFFERAKKFETPWEKFDIMKDYRATISEEEQKEIFLEVADHYPTLEASRRRLKRQRTMKF